MEKNRIMLTDEDGEYRKMVQEIAEHLHDSNPLELPVSQRRRIRKDSGVVIGDTLKIIIKEYHKQCT